MEPNDSIQTAARLKASAQRLARVLKSRKKGFTVLAPHFPPFCEVGSSSDEIKGIMPDLFRHMGKQLGIAPIFKPTDTWLGYESAIWEGEATTIAAPIYAQKAFKLPVYGLFEINTCSCIVMKKYVHLDFVEFGSLVEECHKCGKGIYEHQRANREGTDRQHLRRKFSSLVAKLTDTCRMRKSAIPVGFMEADMFSESTRRVYEPFVTTPTSVLDEILKHLQNGYIVLSNNVTLESVPEDFKDKCFNWPFFENPIPMPAGIPYLDSDSHFADFVQDYFEVYSDSLEELCESGIPGGRVLPRKAWGKLEADPVGADYWARMAHVNGAPVVSPGLCASTKLSEVEVDDGSADDIESVAHLQLEGELIEFAGESAICWIEAGGSVRVQTELPKSVLKEKDELLLPGDQFVLNHGNCKRIRDVSGTILSQKDLKARLDGAHEKFLKRLENWEPRMADEDDI